jgi:hypothetical protein
MFGAPHFGAEAERALNSGGARDDTRVAVAGEFATPEIKVRSLV